MAENLYLIQIDYEYHGLSFQDIAKLLLDEIQFYLDERNQSGCTKHLYKTAGERTLYIIVQQNAKEVDTMLLSSPFSKTIGDQTKITVTELICYETFATSIRKMVKKDNKVYDVVPVVDRKAPHLFWVVISFGYKGHTLDEFLGMWCEEAEAALGAKSRGMIVDLWKCLGRREVIILMNMESVEQLDEVLSFRLPMVKSNGANVNVKVKPIRNCQILTGNLRKLVAQD